MQTLKKIKPFIDADKYEAFKKTIINLSTFSKLKIEIAKVDPFKKEVIFSIQQVEKLTDDVYDNKAMHDIVRPFVDDIESEGWKVHLRPIKPFFDTIGSISASWVKSMMEATQLTQSKMCDDLGIDKFVMSKLLSNKVGFTRWHKATFYYYFKLIKN